MASHVVKLPDVGEGTTEAEIVQWHVAVGDSIREEDPLVDVMTDKATVEIPAPVGGVVRARHGEVGEKRPVGAELVEIEVAGEGREARAGEGGGRPAAPAPAAPSLAPSPAAPGPAPSPAAPRAAPIPAAPAPAAPPPAPSLRAQTAGIKPLASPAVRRRALELGLPLQFVPGSGPAGRITREDLDAYVAAPGRAAAAAQPAPAPQDAVEEIAIQGLRRAIAERVQQAKRHIPHFSYIEEVDVTLLEALRRELNGRKDGRAHLTMLPFLMRAIVNAVARHPQLNARFDDEAGILRRHRAVHIGIATQSEAGLVVPVVHHAEALDLWASAAELARLAEAVRAGTATRPELVGSTITITSLGRLGGIASTPVINYPEVAIVGVNRIAERPVVRDGQIAIRQMMNLSSSFDHRIVDGWEAASFIQAVKEALEQPALLFMA